MKDETWLGRLFILMNAFALMFIAAALACGQEPRATGYKPPTPQQRTAAYQRDQARNGARVAMLTKMTAPPAKFDCVEMGWCPPIRDQGNCGSCYGVATADQLTCAFIKAGYQKNDDSFEINFQFGLDRCGPNFGGCNGGWGAEVAEWMIGHGFPAERWVDASGKTINDYPAYSARPSSCRERSGAKRWKPVEMGFCSGSSSRSATVAEIKACLMQYGVINIAFNASSAYGNAGKNVVRIRGGANHETTLVGWDDSKQAWKTRGNWGTGLGDGGYVWMTFDSELVDPFWLVATQLPPPPDPPTPPDPPPGSLVISPGNVTLAPGKTQQFTITPTGTYAWSASGGTVVDGLYTAPSTVGSYTVSATVPGDPTKYAIAKVTVGTTPTPVEGATIILTKPLAPGTYQIVPGGLKEVEPMKPPEDEETEEPPVKDECCTYDTASKKARTQNKPLVVGIGCESIKGDWLSCEMPAPWHIWKRPVVVVSVPVRSGGDVWMEYIAELPPGSAPDAVAKLLKKRAAYNPVKQKTFQSR